MKKRNTAREAALTALSRCRRDGAWSAQAIDAAIREYHLDPRDAALTSRLCLGVLQNTSLLDYYLAQFCQRKPEPKVQDILRLGAYQLLMMDKIPGRAAVNESVDLCRAMGNERAGGLVNAVLRRISENRAHLPEIPRSDIAQYLAIRYSHPKWLAERIIREHDAAFAEAFFAANNRPQGLTIQVNTLKIDPEEYQRTLDRKEIAYETFPGIPGCLHLQGGAVSDLPGYEEGLFFVQDRAARSAVLAAGPRPGMRVLDTCAAPGGKSFAAAMEMKNEGTILSCDLHEKKLRLIDAGAERLGIGILETMARDAREEKPDWIGAFDLVMTDVPCSGLGVIGKRPEIRWKSEEELSALPDIQAAIMDRAASFVRPGCVLLYSTCTVLDAENGEQIHRFLARHPEYQAEEFQVGDWESRDGMLAFWPHIHGTDGFFAAKLRRKQDG